MSQQLQQEDGTRRTFGKPDPMPTKVLIYVAVLSQGFFGTHWKPAESLDFCCKALRHEKGRRSDLFAF
jgi:hypothetical protein